MSRDVNDSPRAYQRRGLFTALGFAGVVLFGGALGVDQILRSLGVGMHPWADAAGTMLFATLVSYFAARLFWRMGLVTLRHYMIGAFALMTPLTLVSCLGLYPTGLFLLEASWAETTQTLGGQIILSAYVRLIRAALLVPIFLLAFYWFYHVHLRMNPEQ